MLEVFALPDLTLNEVIDARSNGCVRFEIPSTIFDDPLDTAVVELDGELELDTLEAILEYARRQVNNVLTDPTDLDLLQMERDTVKSKLTYSLSGISPGKGGRVWIDDASFSLLSLANLVNRLHDEYDKQPYSELLGLIASWEELNDDGL